MELKLGLVGCGYWGSNYIRLLAPGVGRGRLVACADHSPDVAQRVRQLAPDLRVYASHDEMLEAESLDAVIVATPASSHSEVALDCLHIGLPVLVEKPLARTVSDGEAILAAAAKKHLPLGVGHIYLFNPYVRLIRELIDGGELGDLVTARFERTGFGPIRTDVGALWDLASHDVSMLNYWSRSLPEYVLAEGQCYLRETIDDFMTASLRYSTGLFASMTASWMEPVKVRRVTLCGEKAMIVFDDAATTLKLTVYRKSVQLSEDGHVEMVDEGAHSPETTWTEPLAAVVKDFVEAVDEQRAPFFAGEAGLDVVRVLEAMQDSIERKAGVSLTTDSARAAGD